jgi:hypothetical protein
MKKLAIALALSCISLTSYAQESSEEVVNETEVSTGSDAETTTSGGDETSPQHEDDSTCGK